MFKKITAWLQERKYRENEVITQFVARDVRRDVKVVSTERIKEGIILAEVKTWNVLYVSRGLQDDTEFEPAKEIEISKLWDWSGESWGGLPDGTSLVDKTETITSRSEQCR